MKEFRRQNGRVAGKTMTVAELRAKLESYPADMPVFACWEGVNAYVEPDSFEVEKVSKGDFEGCDSICIDVNTY